ncbi:MAG: hypothetical protein ACXVKA_07480 [Acidimicrobiia bacterium]
MTEPFAPDELGETPTIEVTVFRDGQVIHRELCQTDEEATAVAEHWSETGAVECQIDDLSVHHRASDVLEPSESELPDDGRRSPTDDDIG